MTEIVKIWLHYSDDERKNFNVLSLKHWINLSNFFESNQIRYVCVNYNNVVKS